MTDHEALRTTLAKLEPQHRANLGYILGLDDGATDVDTLSDAIRWRYHSRLRTRLLGSGPYVIERVKRSLGGSEPSVDTTPPAPTYPELLSGLARKLGIKPVAPSPLDADLETLEKQVIYTVISICLDKMRPEQRVAFFETKADVSAVLIQGVSEPEWQAPLKAMSFIGLASTVGVPLSLAASTALGLVTHAVGVTLPHALVAGVGATAGVLTGPVGWLTAGGWLLWRVTNPEWKVLAQVVVYLISLRHPMPPAAAR